MGHRVRMTRRDMIHLATSVLAALAALVAALGLELHGPIAVPLTMLIPVVVYLGWCPLTGRAWVRHCGPSLLGRTRTARPRRHGPRSRRPTAQSR
jgi:hypothetical protein